MVIYDITNKRQLLLYSYQAGVDPIIIDEILKCVDPIIVKRWRTDIDIFNDGIFFLACHSGNFDLVQHVLNVASTEQLPGNVLGTVSKHILSVLELVICNGDHFEEDLLLRLIRLSCEVIDTFPDQYIKKPTDHT
jgi:hypothetical protein